jgi:hypothetical protein
MTKGPMLLVCTRLADMTVVHPEQTQEHCSQCQHMVGVYPTGQRAIKDYPEMKIMCNVCASWAITPEDEIEPAGTREEIVKERDESVPVGRA